MPSPLHCEHRSGFPPTLPNLTCRSLPHVQIFVVRLIILSDLQLMHAVRGPPLRPNLRTIPEPHEHFPPQDSSGFLLSDKLTMPSVLQSMQFVLADGPFLPWSTWVGGYPKRLTFPEPQEHCPVE